MRKVSGFTLFVVALVFSFGTVFAAPPGKIVIKEIQKTKPPVAYDHKAHSEKVKECAACHHKDAAGKEQKCGKCHGAKTDGKKVDLKESFHKQCKDCHKKEKKGPVKCEGCHTK